MSNTKFVLRTVTLTIAAFVLVFLLVGLLLADRFEISTARTISAKPDQIAALLTNLETWPDWSAFQADCGTPTTHKVEGAPGSVGHRTLWSGPRRQAVLELTRAEDGALGYRLGHHEQHGDVSVGGVLTGSITWQPDGEGTRVTWTESGQLDSIQQRWVNWFGAHQEMVKQVQSSSLSGLADHLRKHK